MIEYSDKIRETAKRLLSEGKVDVFIGYKKGSVPMINYPVVIKDADKADELHWDSNCAMNLASYLVGRKDKVGILATGCSSRNIVTLIQENQIKREQLYIVGIPCTGMVDKSAVAAKFDGKEILSVSESGDKITVEGDGFKEELTKVDYLQRNCRICTHRNPVISDELVAAEVAEQEGYMAPEDIVESEGQSDRERWDMFEKTFEACIRCYACRNACPMCYCPTCFVDEAKPQWVGKSNDTTDTLTFHFLRAFHLGGRCTDCGACERACPLDIPVRYLTSRLNKDSKEIYDYESGLDPELRPLLDFYKLTDLNDFIK